MNRHVHFEPIAPVALADESVAVRLHGLASGQRAVIRLVSTGRSGLHWESWAEFEADESGTIDLTAQAPIAGSYAGCDPAGLFWSRRRMDESTRPLVFTAKQGGIALRLFAEVADRVVATQTQERLYKAPEVEAVPVNDGIVGILYRPKDWQPRPGVIVLGGSSGGLLWSEAYAALLASRGFCTLALAYFNMGSLPKLLDNIPLEYFDKAISWLQERPECTRTGIGAVGLSRGGELALLLGSRYADIRAVVSYSGSSLLWGGPNYHTPSWSCDGAPLAFVQNRLSKEWIEAMRAQSPVPVRQFFEYHLDLPSGELEPATIPVERTNGGILLFSGTSDDMWPSERFAASVVERLKRQNFPHPVEHYCYPGAGHRILWPYEPVTESSYIHAMTGRTYSFGGCAEGDSRAASDSWPRATAFLRRTLA